MITTSFIVTLRVDQLDAPTLAGIADDIHDELVGQFDVVVVKPYAHPVTAPFLAQPETPGPLDQVAPPPF